MLHKCTVRQAERSFDTGKMRAGFCDILGGGFSDILGSVQFLDTVKGRVLFGRKWILTTHPKKLTSPPAAQQFPDTEKGG